MSDGAITGGISVEETELFIRRDPATGDVILSRKPADWDGFFAAVRDAQVPGDFLDPRERDQDGPDRDPFQDWVPDILVEDRSAS